MFRNCLIKKRICVLKSLIKLLIKQKIIKLWFASEPTQEATIVAVIRELSTIVRIIIIIIISREIINI